MKNFKYVFFRAHTFLYQCYRPHWHCLLQLFNSRYASSTVNTYVSAIGYFHRLAGLRDPTKTFYISEMLKGYGEIGYKLDSRLPIILPSLVRIMQGLDIFCVSQYELFMFKAMCAMAFFAFLRPLFINHDGYPVLRSEFSKMLGSVIRLCNLLDPTRYKGHSFRIGAATYAAEPGVSDTKIRHLGRWKTDDFKKCIRITSLESVSQLNVSEVVMLLLAGAAQLRNRTIDLI